MPSDLTQRPNCFVPVPPLRPNLSGRNPEKSGHAYSERSTVSPGTGSNTPSCRQLAARSSHVLHLALFDLEPNVELLHELHVDPRDPSGFQPNDVPNIPVDLLHQ